MFTGVDVRVYVLHCLYDKGLVYFPLLILIPFSKPHVEF